MKVKELIYLLSTFDGELEVVHWDYYEGFLSESPIFKVEKGLANTWDWDNNCAEHQVVLK